MSKKTGYLLGILLTIIIGTFLYWTFCCKSCNEQNKNNQEKLDNNSVLPDKKEATLWPFSVKDTDGNLSFSTKENFNFKVSDFKILDSVSSSIDDGVLKVKEYLDANGQKRFNITGYYTNEETNTSAFPNLGLARANAVKNYMSSKGISSKLINTYGEVNNDMLADANGIFYGPLGFDIFTEKEENSSVNDVALIEACNVIKKNPIVLRFLPGQAKVNLTEDQRKKMATISRCVDKLGAKIQVVGHTDDVGPARENMNLGQERANFVKEYLIENGILSSNINTISKGEMEPVTTNNTKAGKSRNRRTVITIN